MRICVGTMRRRSLPDLQVLNKASVPILGETVHEEVILKNPDILLNDEPSPPGSITSSQPLLTGEICDSDDVVCRVRRRYVIFILAAVVFVVIFTLLLYVLFNTKIDSQEHTAPKT